MEREIVLLRYLNWESGAHSLSWRRLRKAPMTVGFAERVSGDHCRHIGPQTFRLNKKVAGSTPA